MKRKAYEMSDSDDASEEETYEEAPLERTDFEDKTFLTGQSVVVGTVALEELVSDDTEAWIIKVPRNVDVRKLHDQVLDLEGNSTVTLGDSAFEVETDHRKKRVPLIVPHPTRNTCAPVSLECQGEVTLVEAVNVPDLPRFKKHKRKIVPQPTGLKERHPLFGIDKPPSLTSRSTPGRSAKKTKKRKHEEPDSSILNIGLTKISLLSPEKKPSLKELDESPSKKQKKKKNLDSSVQIPMETESQNESLTKKDRKKKKKRDSHALDKSTAKEGEGETEIKQENHDEVDESVTKKKKKKKKTLDLDVTPKVEQETEEEELGSSSQKKKKKKKKKHKEETE